MRPAGRSLSNTVQTHNNNYDDYGLLGSLADVLKLVHLVNLIKIYHNVAIDLINNFRKSTGEP